MNTLIIDSIQKYFDDKLILSDIYLKCETKNIIGIFGRNGSGKSTLFKIIFGTLKADFKHIRLNNKVLETPYIEKNAISFLPQFSFIPNHLTVKKLLKISFGKNFEKIIDENEILKPIVNQKVINLSGGERKFLEVLYILNLPTKFCLLDEPYNGVSPIYVDKINELILKNSQEKGIIISDHNYEALLRITTHIYYLKNGVGKFLETSNDLVSVGYLR